ncbi:MAG: hypothetical protein EOM23_07775, partial [Candidatus Moranbacteria bacterium]|nr:hypothetical protein [Candidatus Moranbacteria bacterium]
MYKIWSKISAHYSSIYKALIFMVSLVVLVSFFPKEAKFKFEYNRGRPWMHQDLIAPFDFAVLKPADEIEKERNDILQNKTLYFDFKIEVNEQVRKAFIERFERDWSNKYADKKLTPELKKSTIEEGLNILTKIHSRGVLQSIPEIGGISDDHTIMLIIQNVAERVSSGDFYTVQTAYDAMIKMLESIDNVDKSLLKTILGESISQNIFFNERVTNAELQQRIERISTTRGMVQEGERIISKGEVVTPARYQLLESLRTEYETRIGIHSNYYLIFAGQVILVALSLFVLGMFLYVFRKEVLDDNKKVILILLTIILMVFITSITLGFGEEYIFIVPLCIT